MKILSILILFLMLVQCGNKEEGEGAKEKGQTTTEDSAAPGDETSKKAAEKDLSDGTAPSGSFESYELEEIQKISAVYNAKTNTIYGLLGWTVKTSIKISIHHNGDDENKQLIVKIERAGKPSALEIKAKGDKGFVCSLYTDFTLKLSSWGGSKSIDSDDIQNAGQLGNIGKIKLQQKIRQEQPFELFLDRKDSFWTTNKAQNIEKTSENLPSFDTLYSSCFKTAPDPR